MESVWMNENYDFFLRVALFLGAAFFFGFGFSSAATKLDFLTFGLLFP